MESEVAREPRRGVYVALGLTAFATLLLEIGLTRVFSYTIWYHFAFVVIAVALLGFGASGSLLTLRPSLLGASSETALSRSALFSSLGTVAVLLCTTHVRVEPFDILREPVNLAAFLLYFVVVTIPFFGAGASVALALRDYRRRAATLYFSDLLGAGLGCLAVVFVINVFGPRQLIVLSVVSYGAAALLFLGRLAPKIAGVAFGAVAVAQADAALFDFIPSATKLASKYERSGGRIIESHWSAVFRTDLYDFGDRLDLSRDPSLTVYGSGFGGLGKRYEGKFPSYRFIAHDGDASAVMVNNDGTPEDAELYRHHLLGVPYRFRPNADVFIGGVGGGIDVLSAVSNGARSVRGVELDPNTVRIVCQSHGDYVGGVCDRNDVTIQYGDARSVVRRTDERYDIINFTGVDTITAAANGAYILTEGYLYTVEAFQDYYDHLTDRGVVSIITGDIGGGWGPPRMVPRFASVIARALELRGVERPADHVIIVGTSMPEGTGISHEVVLSAPRPFSVGDIELVARIAEDEGFVFWHRPDRAIDTVASKILRLGPEERAEYLDQFYLDYSATTDDRPFFMHFYKFRSLGSHLSIGHRYTEATGNVILLLALGLALLSALGFIVAPAVVAARRNRSFLTAADVLYFSAIGLGFMLVEISIVQSFTLLLGYPTYSLTVTLFSMLVFAAAGSALSAKVPEGKKPRWIIAGVLATVLLLHLAFGALVQRTLLPLTLPVRAFAAVLLLAPLGLVLGMFLPLGMRDLSRDNPRGIPLAWAANGTFSVVGTTSATLLATLYGFDRVLMVALLCYAVAVLAAWKRPRAAAA